MRKILVSSFVLLVACGADYPRPRAAHNLTVAQASTRGAEVVGARNVPQAALHLKLAEEQIARAEKLMEDERYERASYLARRAYNDAEVALWLARQQVAEQQAARVQQFAQARESQLRGSSAANRPDQQR